MILAYILVVDNDAHARRHIVSELRELGHRAAVTAEAGPALEAVKQACPDLMVWVFVLPGLTGIELLSDTRRSENLRKMRVLMTSARSGSDDVVAALKSGADDFVGKPINMGKRIARVGACLRRAAKLAASDTVGAGGISMDDVVGERVFAFGRLGPDAIEQPFESLDFTCFWYPTGRMTVKAKAQNILGSTVEIRRLEPGRDVTVFEEDPGTSFALALSWHF